MAKDQLRFEEVWPASVADLSAAVLRRLSDNDFQRVKKLVMKRAIQQGNGATFAKQLGRQLELKRRKDRRNPYSRTDFLARFKPGEILDALVPNRQERWRPVFKRKLGQRVDCTGFSFLDNPIPTYNSLITIAEADCEALHYKVDFNDEHVTDIGPFLVFGVMREQMAPLSAGGIVLDPTKKVLEAVGLRAFLKMRPFNVSVDDVWPLPLVQRRKGGTSNPVNLASEPSTVELRADEIAKKMDLWLGQLTPPGGLTHLGTGRIKSIITETLNNAERHGRPGGDGEWITAGFMARRPSSRNGGGQLLHVCHLSFLNLGRPISETVMEGPNASQIAKYQRIHQRSGLSPNTLATVFALQDGISRLPQGDENPSGGTGIMDMVEFANEVGSCTLPGHGSKVAILSGRSYICFRAPYAEGFGTQLSDRRLQWFNTENAVRKAPDQGFVMDLPRAFPGTLITMRFVLDGSMQEEVTGDDNG